MAVIDVTNSGNDVPRATTVSPITFSLIFNAFAIATAASTTIFPPKMRKANPKIMNNTILTEDSVLTVIFLSSTFVVFMFL